MKIILAIASIGFFVVLAFFPFQTFAEEPGSGEKVKSFEVEITLSQENAFLVRESIFYDFGDNLRHGIYRLIPKGKMKMKVLAVEDENGNGYPYEDESNLAMVSIRIGDADSTVTGEHLYKISYEVKKGIRFFKEYDELFWNVTGNNWRVPIEKSSAKVFLPQDVGQENLMLLCFTGTVESKEKDCSFFVDEGGAANFASNSGFNPEEGLTFALGFPKGIIKEPNALEKAIDFLAINWPLFIIPFVFLYLFLQWWKKGRDFPLKKPIIAEYEAPDNLGPAEVGVLVTQTAKSSYLSSIIVDLARRGYLKIKEEEQKVLGFEKKEYSFIKGKELDGELKKYERRLLKSIFVFNLDKREEVVKLDSLKDKFYTNISLIKESLYKQLSDGGYFVSRPDKARNKWIFSGAGFLSFAFMFFFLSISLQNETMIRLVISLVICACFFFIFSMYMPKRTEKGAEAYWKCLGLKDYINTAEKYRVQFHEKENIFEKILPYAIIFGLTYKWAKAFEGIYQQPPDWYQGNFATFSAINFSNSLNHSLSSMNSALFSQPGSSGSGSGFGGGGFSGGGGGGGGGGSW